MQAYRKTHVALSTVAIAIVTVKFRNLNIFEATAAIFIPVAVISYLLGLVYKFKQKRG